MPILSLERLISPKFIESRKTLFLLFFLALSAVALSAWQGISYFLGKQERAVLLQNAINDNLINLQQRSAEYLSGNAISLNIVASSPSLRQFSSRDTVLDVDLKKLFKSLIESSPNVFQIRYIDSSGYEKVRVDKHKKKLKFVNPEELQFKGSRNYFVEASKLNKGQIYVSDLDLNVEAGRVAEPWIPTIRLATPVFNTDYQSAGILIINVDASDILAIYNQANNVESVDIMLFNDRGYWIYGGPQDAAWGFMFNRPVTLATELPAAWQAMQIAKQTNFSIDSNIWTTRPATVASVFPQSLTYSEPNKIIWHAAIINPPTIIAWEPAEFVPSMAILLALISFSWAWTKSVIARHRTEKELVKSEKLSSLGGLVAGVAHELNTPIGSAVTIASTMEDQAKEIQLSIQSGKINKSQIVAFVDDISHTSNIMLRSLGRATELIGHFKQIAVDQTGEQRRAFEFDAYIEEMSTTFKHLFKHRQIVLETNLTSKVSLDTFPGSLSQVVINLVQNALIHGFDKDDRGTIRIATSSKDGKLVKLSVTDTGKGIPAKVIDRVFDPFFTTKLGVGGSGLGLHITYNIVNDILGGSIEVASFPERHFTQFIILLPCEGYITSHNSPDKPKAVKGLGYV